MNPNETPEQVAARRAREDNAFWLDQLRFRRSRIEKLIPLQKVPLAAEMFRSELNYVNAMIEFRERHEMKQIVLD